MKPTGIVRWLGSILLLPALAAAGWLALQRLLEDADPSLRRVELAFDAGGLAELCHATGHSFPEALADLRTAGVAALGIHEDTPESLATSGRAAVFTMADAGRLRALGSRAATLPPLTDGELCVTSEDRDLLERVEVQAAIHLGLPRVRVVRSSPSAVVLAVTGKDAYENLPLGYSPELVQQAVAVGFRPVFRMSNFSPSSEGSFRALLRSLPRPSRSPEGGEPLPPILVFDKEEALGYDRAIPTAATALSSHGWPVALLEFADQKGATELFCQPGMLPLLLPATGITRRELESGTPERAVSRWVLAARERGAALLYLQPYLLIRGNVYGRNLAYVRAVASKLSSSGFTLGGASPRPIQRVPDWAWMLAGLGALAGFLFLVEATFGAEIGPFLGAIAVFALVSLVVSSGWSTLRLREAWALTAAISFPAAALFRVRPPVSKGSPLLPLLRTFGELVAYGLVAGLLISALLYDSEWRSRVRLFVGVKASLLLPPLLVLGGMLLPSRALSSARAGWNVAATRRWVVGLAVIIVMSGAGLGILALRSGNTPPLRPSTLEERGRDWLGAHLLTRPRTKEFLIGYPLLFLSLAFPLRRRTAKEAHAGATLAEWFSPAEALAAVAGTVGLASLANSFCHLHTPLAMTLLRSFHGVWIGAVLGLLISWIVLRWRKS